MSLLQAEDLRPHAGRRPPVVDARYRLAPRPLSPPSGPATSLTALPSMWPGRISGWSRRRPGRSTSPPRATSLGRPPP